MHITTKIQLICRGSAGVKQTYQKVITETLCELSDFFCFQLNKIEVYVYEDRSEFMQSANRDESAWLVACIPPNSTKRIYIHHDSKKKNTHARQIVLHECAHLFTNTLNKHLPDWLKEGISVYCAEQIYSKTISIDDWMRIEGVLFLDDTQWRDEDIRYIYAAAGLIVRDLIKVMGREKLLKKMGLYTKGDILKYLCEPEENANRWFCDFKRARIIKKSIT